MTTKCFLLIMIQGRRKFAARVGRLVAEVTIYNILCFIFSSLLYFIYSFIFLGNEIKILQLLCWIYLFSLWKVMAVKLISCLSCRLNASVHRSILHLGRPASFKKVGWLKNQTDKCLYESINVYTWKVALSWWCVEREEKMRSSRCHTWHLRVNKSVRASDCLPMSCRSLLKWLPSAPWPVAAYKFSIDYTAQRWFITDKHRSRYVINWGRFFIFFYFGQPTRKLGMEITLNAHSPCFSQWAAGRAECCCPPLP